MLMLMTSQSLAQRHIFASPRVLETCLCPLHALTFGLWLKYLQHFDTGYQNNIQMTLALARLWKPRKFGRSSLMICFKIIIYKMKFSLNFLVRPRRQ